MVLAPPCRGPLESFKHDAGPRHSITTQHDTSDSKCAVRTLLYDKVTKGWPSFLESRGSAETWLDQLQF